MIRLASSSSILSRYVSSRSKSNPLDADEGEESELALLLLDAGACKFWKTGTTVFGFILGAKIEMERQSEVLASYLASCETFQGILLRYLVADLFIKKIACRQTKRLLRSLLNKVVSVYYRKMWYQ